MMMPKQVIEREYPLPLDARQRGWRLAECFRKDPTFAILDPAGEVLMKWPAGMVPTNGEVDDKVAELVASAA